MNLLFFFILIASLSLTAVFDTYAQGKSKDPSAQHTLKVKSPAFQEGGMIPKAYTCDGRNISPPLEWSDVPGATKSIAVIVEDPDAPGMVFTHWVVYNLPPETRSLPESMPDEKQLKNGTRQGMNDFLKVGFGGLCPPTGTHRYYFKVYALDMMLDMEPGLTKQHLLNKMKGHILADGQLMGKYKR
jgi:Raf kinase inhibitor-like YbhB/YbcL family protein